MTLSLSDPACWNLNSAELAALIESSPAGLAGAESARAGSSTVRHAALTARVAGSATDPDAVALRRARRQEREKLSLRPQLTATNTTALSGRAALSHDGYFDTVATIGLCQGLELHLTGVHGHALSHRALADLGISLHTAWNIAARNLAREALRPEGFLFRTRPFGGGLQVKTPKGDITAWIAHPVTFGILFEHARRLLGCEQPLFLAPAQGTLVIADAAECDGWTLFGEASAAAHPHVPTAAVEPLLWANGFPRPYWPGARTEQAGGPRAGTYYLPAGQ